MEEKDTDKLLHSLKKAESFKSVFAENQPYAVDQSVKRHLEIWLEKKDLAKGNVLKAAALPETTGYQYFDGKRVPPREKMIALIIGLNLNLEEAAELLKKTGYAQLYAKHSWDAVIIYGIAHQLSIHEINDLLYGEGLNTFYD